MENNKLGLILFSLTLSSGTILVNRFIFPVPEWMAYIIIILSVSVLIKFIVDTYKKVYRK